MNENNICKKHFKKLKYTFLYFLKKENIYKDYKINYIKFHQKYGKNQAINLINPLHINRYQTNYRIIHPQLYYIYFKQLIISAFDWTNTPQGCKYWNNLNRKWIKLLENFIHNNI